MLNPTVQDSQPTTEDMQWWKNQTGFCLCCSRSSGRRYLVRESCLIHRLDLWPHVIFLPFQGELFLYQMREPGEFSINMCSGLISPPMSSSSSDWSILHTHRNCVCVCVCVRARMRAHAESLDEFSLGAPAGAGPSQDAPPDPVLQVALRWLLLEIKLHHPRDQPHLHWFPHSPSIHAHFYYHIWFLDFTCVCVRVCMSAFMFNSFWSHGL